MKRFKNKGTLTLQIIYAVICTIFAVWMFMMIGDFISQRDAEEAGVVLGLIIYLAIYIYAAVILFVIALLFWIFCKRPLIATFGYALLAVAFAAALIVINFL